MAAVAVGAEASGRVRQTLDDDAPFAAAPPTKRLVRVALDEKPEPLRAHSARRITASLDKPKVAYVGSGTVKRRIRLTLDDQGYLGEAPETKPRVPTRAFPDPRQSPATKRVIRQQLVDGPAAVVAARPRPLRTTLD